MTISVKYDRGKPPVDSPGTVPVKFKRYVDKKKRKLNELSPESKVVAALNKILAAHGKESGANYYVAGETIWCPNVHVTEGRADKPGAPLNRSYQASGRFKIGKYKGEALTFGVMQFSITFRDGEDDEGFQDLIIEQASMDELEKTAPLSE